MTRFEHSEEKWIFPFVEYSCDEKCKNLPLIIQLHGAGERGNGKDELALVDVHGFSKHLETDEYKCIVVMPQCPANTFWTARIESIIKFIEQIIREYDVDESRVYLTGLSMGGYGTWLTAMDKPDMFAAIAPVCGGGMAWNAGVLKMPIWAFHGSEDLVVSPMQTEEMVLKLKEAGADIKYTHLDGVAHNAWDYAYNSQLLEWMLSKQKK